jgi:ubiquinone/menaquinone biosynthesis C-methylase UbiE
MTDSISKWIKTNCEVIDSNSSEALYGQMVRQCPIDIPGVYRKYDPLNIKDWYYKINDMRFTRNLKRDYTALDIGCGDGYPSLLMAPYCKKVIGIDNSDTRVNKSRENAKLMGLDNVEFIRMSGEKLEFEDNSFDVVASSTSIEQASDYNKVLREIHRILKSGGHTIIRVQNFNKVFTDGESRINTVNISDKKDHYLIVYKILDKEEFSEEAYCLSINKDEKVNQHINEFNQYPDNHMEGLKLDDKLSDEFSGLLDNAKSYINKCLHFKVKHISPNSFFKDLKNAGFTKVYEIFDRLPILRNSLKTLEDKRLLSFLAPKFEEIITAFYDINVPDGLREDGATTMLAYK